MSECYFTVSPAVEAEEYTRRFTIRGAKHAVATTPGAFSADCFDKGTQVLFDHVPDPSKTGTLLDLERDQGPVMPALAGAAPGATILAADVNERSLAPTARNTAATDLDNVCTFQAEALLAELRQALAPADLTQPNSPMRVGKDVLHELLLSWLALLSADGEAWLVVLRSLGTDSLAIWLSNQG